ncbi:MAG TPA: DNA-3-methyladenine glycosylase [Actinomycetota bacterium]|nr:DNA-3-methyladenine glycosylase [Actinomycetota bacterium]
MNLRPLARRFYGRDAVTLARDLLGRLVVRELDGARLVGRVVEAEAYARDDPASHAYRGPTRRNASMFGPPGHAYVYVSHGIHHCLNVVARPGSAVLIRALEPLEGLDDMRRRRGVEAVTSLCSGPGRLCQALGITLADDGADLTDGERLWVAPGRPARDALVTARIGITAAAEVPWRFVAPGTTFASRPPAIRRRRRA